MPRQSEDREQVRWASSNAIRRVCNMIAALLLAYALVCGDVPVGLVAIATLVGNFPDYSQTFHVKVAQDVAHILHVCSMTMFAGAIVLVLFY